MLRLFPFCFTLRTRAFIDQYSPCFSTWFITMYADKMFILWFIDLIHTHNLSNLCIKILWNQIFSFDWFTISQFRIQVTLVDWDISGVISGGFNFFTGLRAKFHCYKVEFYIRSFYKRRSIELAFYNTFITNYWRIHSIWIFQLVNLWELIIRKAI